MRGMQEILTRIPENLLEVSGECYHSKVPGKYLGRFQGIFKKIPGYIQEVSGECSDSEEYSRKCSRRLRGILKKILGKV